MPDAKLSVGIDDQTASGASAAAKSFEKVDKAGTKAAQNIDKQFAQAANNIAANADKFDRVLDRKVKVLEKRESVNTATAEQRKSLVVVKAILDKGVIDHRNAERIKTNDTILENERRKKAVKSATDFITRYERERDDPWRRLAAGATGARVSPSQFLFGNLNAQLAASAARQQMFATSQRQGVPLSQIWQQQMNAALARSNAAQAAAGFMPPGVLPGGGGGGRGGIGSVLGRILGMGGGGAGGALVSSLAGGFGVGLGGYALARGVEAVRDAAALATAYDRQRVAAINLAGSQAELNELLEAYHKSSGGAVDNVTALHNVTRLLSTGFAKSSGDVERFVKATRGASIALGKPQDYVIQETQLAISNTSVKRLDQIGLGIQEVSDRTKELRGINKDWSREMAFQEAVIGLLEEKYGKLTSTVEGQATGVERLTKTWADLRLEMAQGVQGPVNQIAGAASTSLSILGGGLLEAEMRKLESYIVGIRSLVLQLGGSLPWTIRSESEFIGGSTPRDIGRHRRTGTSPLAEPLSQYSEDQRNVIISSYQQLEQVDRQYYRQRIAETEQYEEQRSSIIRNYGKQMAREEEDFQRQRARGLRDYEREILDVMRDAQERDREMQEDLDERLADLHEDGNDRLEDLQENYNKEREKAERTHRENLLKAAANLDAVAVAEEQRRYKQEQRDRKEAYEDQVDEQKESLDKQVEKAVEAHEEQLEDARRADEKRLQDMAVARERQLADENEDREIRNARAAEDHQEQLNELDRQHSITMERLAREAEDQRQAIQDALAADLGELGLYIEGYHEKMKERDKLIEEWFDKIIERIEKEIRNEEASTYRYDERTGPELPYEKGGVYGSSFTEPEATISTTSSGGTIYTSNQRSVVVQPGAVIVNESSRPGETGEEVYNAIASLVDGGLMQ